MTFKGAGKLALVPVVDVPGVCQSERAFLVQVDDAAIAGMAAGHLWELGFREFAYLGVTPDNWSLARPEAFEAWVGNHGCPCRSLLLALLTLEWGLRRRWIGGQVE